MSPVEYQIPYQCLVHPLQFLCGLRSNLSSQNIALVVLHCLQIINIMVKEMKVLGMR